MQFRFSPSLHLSVPAHRIAAAKAYYMKAFGLTEGSWGSSDRVHLEGPNKLSMWITAIDPGLVLHEWVASTPRGAKEHLLALGCKPLAVEGSSDSPAGFYVEDPFGLRYHVYTLEDDYRDEMFGE